MASLKPIVLDGSYIQINRCQISSANERASKIGVALKRSFAMGPGAEESVVTISSKKPGAQAPDEEDKASQQNNQETQSQENSQDQTQSNDSNHGSDTSSAGDNGQSGSDGSSEQSSSGEHHESFHYSILEAYNNMHPVFEDGESSGENSGGDSGGSPSGDGAGSTDSQSDSSDSSSSDSDSSNNDSDSSENDSSDNNDKSDNKGDDKEESDEFDPGSELYVQVLLKGEGCTVWHIQLDSRIKSLSAVVNQLASKSFKAAMSEAKKGLHGDGLIPLSATTYVKKDVVIPFIGHCRYAIDSGSDNAEDDENTIAIAVAPIDGVTKKPSKPTVYKVSFDIKGDITDGKMPFLNKLKDNDSIDAADIQDASDDNDDAGSSRTSSSVSDIVSQWLNGKHKLGKPDFKNVGDSTMYKNFVKLRDFVVENTKKMNEDTPCLELNKEDSESPKRYSNLPAVKKSLIFY